MSYRTNLAAACFEKGMYDECVAECEQAIETGRRVFADYTFLAKAFQRIGNAYMKQHKYKEAVAAYKSSLTEHRISATLDLLRKAEKLQKEKEETEYFSPEKSLEAKEKGNEFFHQGKIPEAIEWYSEAIKRNPQDHVLYSNRAACYTKLGEYPLGLKDCDKALELCPTFLKAYTRKGHIQFFMKQYHKCLETYDQGLKLEPENQELIESIKRTIDAINRLQSEGGEKEAAAAAASDPDIQEILRNPVMQRVLTDMQTSPQATAAYLKDPVIAANIQKLIAAGIVRTK